MRVSSTLSSCLALVAALPGAQSLSRHPDDHALLDLDNIIAERLDLVLKPCTDPLASDADAEDPREVYKGLGCKSLLDGLNYNYTQGKDDTDISYVEYISNRMHGPPNRNCADINNEACSDSDVQCDDTFFTCGSLILNSFANVFNLFRRVYDATIISHDRIQDDLPAFTETFCPQLPDDHFADIVVGIISLGLFGVGTFAEKVIKPVMENVGKLGSYGFVKDGMMIATGSATPLSLNHVPDNLDGSIDSKISSLFGKVYDSFREMEANFVEHLFGGSRDSRVGLQYMIADGAFLRYKDEHDWKDLENEIRKMFYAALIPRAWQMSPTLQSTDRKRYSNPLFINTNKPCDEDPDDLEDSGRVVKDFKKICYEDEGWYMMIAYIEKSQDYHIRQTRWSWGVEKLPGDKHLFGDDGYAGLKVDDMLASAVGAWKKGDHQQYWEPSKDSPVVTGGGKEPRELQFTEGAREPGVVHMLVCAHWGAAIDTIYKAASDDQDLAKDKLWPCG